MSAVSPNRATPDGRDMPETDSGGSATWSPELPGCAATGDTLEEVERELRAAIAFHLEGMAGDGEPIPDPSGPGVYVERRSPAAA